MEIEDWGIDLIAVLLCCCVELCCVELCCVDGEKGGEEKRREEKRREGQENKKQKYLHRVLYNCRVELVLHLCGTTIPFHR